MAAPSFKALKCKTTYITLTGGAGGGGYCNGSPTNRAEIESAMEVDC